MDTNYLRYSSWCLCRLLENIIGTKEEVTLLRKFDAMYDHVIEVDTSYGHLYSGSRGEGFSFHSSDLDLMFICRNTTVLDSLHDRQSADDGKTVLLMKREGCNLGFVILRLLNRTCDPAIRESVVHYNDFPAVSSLLYRDLHAHPEYGDVGHGPCNTSHHFCEVDKAYCFKCDDWPSEANEFIYRQRLYGWPRKRLLEKIISRGCHLVPIGDKNSDLSNIQWRLSFSAAEKDLVHSFNHAQFLVYGLLKIFLKQFINKIQLVEDLLCSYFLKTLLFHSIESTPSSFWREYLFIPCFWFCLNKLIAWVEQGYCPNYFVPQNNMFRDKVFGENQRNLLTVLHLCKHSGWTCICLCKDLRSLQTSINDPESLYTAGLMLNERRRESDTDFLTFIALAIRYTVAKPQNMGRNLARSLKLLRHSRTQQEEDISTLLLYSVLRNIGQTNVCINVGKTNKDKYRKLYHLLLSSAKSNVCTGSLYLATFYYMTGQNKKAVHLCNRVISLWKPYVYHHSSFVIGVIHIVEMYRQYVCGRDVSVIHKAKAALSFDIVVDCATKDFYPMELRHDLEATAPFPVDIPPLPYTVFLLFLCHHKLGNIDQSVTALHDLQVLIGDIQQGCRHYPIVLNMLAACLDKLGDVHGSIEACILSQILKPEKNGRMKMLETILHKPSNVFKI